MQYAVLGDPIAHSLSPTLQGYFARLAGIPLDAHKLHCPAGQLAKTLAHFAEHGGRWANLTAPLKQEGYALCDTLTPAAQAVGAVNTLRLDGNSWTGHNTDAEGFWAAGEERHWWDDAERVLILGAGGAARAVLHAFQSRNRSGVFLWNRTLEKAAHLCQVFPGAQQWEMGKPAPNVIINATSASLSHALPELSIGYEGMKVMDLVYSVHRDTAWLQAARENGAAECLDGWPMLFYQGKAAFEFWSGQTLQTLDAEAAYAGLIAAK